jgi:hypothetical protein
MDLVVVRTKAIATLSTKPYFKFSYTNCGLCKALFETLDEHHLDTASIALFACRFRVRTSPMLTCRSLLNS